MTAEAGGFRPCAEARDLAGTHRARMANDFQPHVRSGEEAVA
ncbi:hypothetical protein ABZ897_02315 [Nonomuraea sp. NPDC046802]